MQNELIDLENRYLAASHINDLLKIDKEYFRYLEEYIKNDSKNVPALIHLGVLSWEPFHKQEQAIAYLKKAIEYDPTNVEARFWLAECYYHDFCDYDNAKKFLLEALQLDPCRADCLSLLSSVIYDTTEDCERAISYLENAIQYAHDWPMLYFCLASLYLRVNNVAAAELQVRKIEQLISLPSRSLRNGIEYYYETIVTGRSNKNIQKKLEQLNERIRETKVK